MTTPETDAALVRYDATNAEHVIAQLSNHLDYLRVHCPIIASIVEEAATRITVLRAQLEEARGTAASEADAFEAANRDLREARDEVAKLREAHKRLRDGYADAAAGLRYVRLHHGALAGVGFDRVDDHFFEQVEMREREGLLAGSDCLPLATRTLLEGKTA